MNMLFFSFPIFCDAFVCMICRKRGKFYVSPAMFRLEVLKLCFTLHSFVLLNLLQLIKIHFYNFKETILTYDAIYFKTAPE